MFGPYLQVLRTPRYPFPFGLGLLVSLPLGMVGLALLLTAQARTGSLASAGLAPAAFGLGNAGGLVVQGRLIDRFGPARVIGATSVVCAAALIGAVTLPDSRALLVCALVGGVGFPATISTMRVLTTALVRDPRLRMSGYALLSVSFGLAMVVGPLLTSLLLAVWTAPGAVLVAAGVVGVGGPVFAATPAVRTWPAHRTVAGSRFRPGAGLVTVLAVNVAAGLASGARAVALPAAAVVQDVPALAGVGFAALSVGDLLGGLAYGAIRWRASKAQQLLGSLAAAAVTSGVAAACAGVLPALFVVLLLGGTVGAAGGICLSALLDDVAPPHLLTTAYTTMVGLSLAASAGGNAAAGSIADAAGPAAGFGLSAAALGLAAGLLYWRRHTLRSDRAIDVSGR